MGTLRFVTYFNLSVAVLIGLAYSYQYFYTLVSLVMRFRKKRARATASMHRFAVLICARNEQAVIGELIESLKLQDYPEELLDLYVLADNCTDGTAEAARAAGALVYERQNKAKVGKGYALDYLIARIREDHPDAPYSGYFIFDADNIVDKRFVSEMNKTYSRGFDVITSYRNSKNFGENWISTAYSIWFLREARYLNFPRMHLGTSCTVSGTGFFVSQSVIDENGGWPFHLLTEDIEFSVDCVINNRLIGYCDTAIVYDEQPVSFRQSWQQRLRWAKGFFQVNRKYSARLVKGIFSSGGLRRSCYDILMTIAPCVFLTVLTLVLNLVVLVCFAAEPFLIGYLITTKVLRYLSIGAVNLYFGLVFFALLTVISEWKRIQATTWQKVKYLIFFPFFMVTYIPIAFAALTRKVEWKPIAHRAASNPLLLSGNKD